VIYSLYLIHILPSIRKTGLPSYPYGLSTHLRWAILCDAISLWCLRDVLLVYNELATVWHLPPTLLSSTYMPVRLFLFSASHLSPTRQTFQTCHLLPSLLSLRRHSICAAVLYL